MQLGDNVALVTMAQQKGRYPVIAMTTRRDAGTLEQALREADFQHEVLPTAEGETAETLCAEKEREQHRLEEQLERLNRQVRALADEFAPSLVAMDTMVEVELGLLRAQQGLSRTEATAVVAGWVPAAEAPGLNERLKEITNGRCAVEITRPANPMKEEVPTLLKHSGLLRPFGMLMSSYGVPNYREMEPTLFVAVSYVLMFGIMFGDAGHGAILAALGVAALFKGRNEKARNVGILLCSCGLFSMLFGIIYGSCFGLEQFKRCALWHDPLEGDPMGLMYGAIVVGIVMISLGLVLNVINRFRRGDVIGGLLDKFGLAGILFYWGMLALLAGREAIAAKGLMGPAMVLFLVVPGLCWVSKEPLEYFRKRSSAAAGGHEATLTIAITESLVGAFEAVLSYLANTISFVRLGAYAMSHAALLVAAYMLAEQVRHLAFGGTLWSVIVIVLGNLVAIVLEGIIASVQALRLEYYEFFGKFFSGDGQAFEPFRLAGSTTRVDPS
jgi:V/A-type H+-transporting ATPase subunit I